MPSTATITTYYTFVAGTKARAAQVNANFSLYRGHIFPIDPNTATGINNTYDSGSAEYRWRNTYQYTSKFPSATTTADAVIEADTASTAGALNFKMNSVTKARIDSDGLDLSYGKSSSMPYLARALRAGFTTSAGIGQIARSAVTLTASIAATTGSVVKALAGSTLTIQTNGSPLVVIMEGKYQGAFNANTTTSKSISIRAGVDQTGSAGQLFMGESFLTQSYATGTAYDRNLIGKDGCVVKLYQLAAGTYYVSGSYAVNGGDDTASSLSWSMMLTAFEL